MIHVVDASDQETEDDDVDRVSHHCALECLSRRTTAPPSIDQKQSHQAHDRSLARPYLIQDRALKSKRTLRLLERLPALERCDRVGYHALLLGFLLFTVEKLQGAGDHQLQASGRYAYAKEYLVGLAGKYGFAVGACREVDLRKEKDQWLQGYLFVLQKN